MTQAICSKPPSSHQERVEYVIASAIEELRTVLPEVCVNWLLQEEPQLLHGVPLQRLEEVRSSAGHNMVDRRGV